MTTQLQNCSACMADPDTDRLMDNMSGIFDVAKGWVDQATAGAKSSINSVVSNASAQIKAQAIQAIDEYSIAHPNKTRLSVAALVVTAAGAICGLYALGKTLRKYK